MQVLLIRKEMTEKLARLQETPPPAPPNPQDLVRFDFDETDFTAVQQYLRNLCGLRIYDRGITQESNVAGRVHVAAAGDGLAQCTVGVPTVVTMTTRDVAGSIVNISPLSFLCRITSVGKGVNYFN